MLKSLNHFAILGVTGTLSSLVEFERKVITEDYKIKKFTVTPSMYGDSQLDFKEKDYVHVEMEEALWMRKIREEMRLKDLSWCIGQPLKRWTILERANMDEI